MCVIMSVCICVCMYVVSMCETECVSMSVSVYVCINVCVCLDSGDVCKMRVRTGHGSVPPSASPESPEVILLWYLQIAQMMRPAASFRCPQWGQRFCATFILGQVTTLPV